MHRRRGRTGGLLLELSVIAPAIGMFAVTNIDDIVVLALFFSQAPGRAGAWRVVAGQYLGFAAILVAAVVGALGAGLLPVSALPYLGLLPSRSGFEPAGRPGPSGEPAARRTIPHVGMPHLACWP